MDTSCCWMCDLKRFFCQCVIWLFTFLIVPFEVQNLLTLLKSILLTFSFIACIFGVVSKKSVPSSNLWRFTPVLFPNEFYSFSFYMYWEVVMSHFLYEINMRLRKIHMQKDQFRILSPVICKNELDRIMFVFSFMWSCSFLKDFKSYAAQRHKLIF